LPRTSDAGGAVTLVEGSDFCLSQPNGDVSPGGVHGLFVLDTRVLSRIELRVDDLCVEGLGVAIDEPFRATFFGRVDHDVVVLRHRTARRGLHDRIVVRNHGTDPRDLVVEVAVDADFADLFEVKDTRVERRGWYGQEESTGMLTLGHRLDGRERSTRIAFEDAPALRGGRARWQVRLAPNEQWSTNVHVTAFVDGEPVEAGPGHRFEAWRSRVPRVETDDATLAAAVARAVDDLGSLQIFDPEHPELPMVAAGTPWFMSPFGRDSILTAWMALIIDPDLALGVLETLARFQGTRVDALTEEEPGRIFHEMRYSLASSLSLGGGTTYYGSVDATPLFVMLLGELRRWGLQHDATERLLQHADRALTWIEQYGDRDGDGYVEYQRATPTGLINQGWKDSWDGVRYGDGRVALAPIALCEVQAYVYGAYVARAHFAEQAGDAATQRRYADKATALKERFNRDFWLPDRQWFAIGLDKDKRPIDSLASNMGHCLWTGIVDEDKARAVADALLTPAMCSGWGIRTLAATEVAYNPVSYHCGSVWPHDNAIATAGLVRYGFVDHAQRVMRGLLDAAAHHDGRLPELFSGLGRDELSVPAAYPTSCSPQAWAAATPLLFIRNILRLDPHMARGRVALAPALPEWVQRLRVIGIPLADNRLTVEVDRYDVRLEGLPDDVIIEPNPRRPLSELVDRH
jgi:glycogen debranching enzyme